MGGWGGGWGGWGGGGKRGNQYNIFLIFPQKHILWVLSRVPTTCFCGEIRQISVFFVEKKSYIWIITPDKRVPQIRGG